MDLRVTAANDAAIQCNLSLYRLECAEHLPVSGQEAAPAAATLAEVRIIIVVSNITRNNDTHNDDDSSYENESNSNNLDNVSLHICQQVLGTY